MFVTSRIAPQTASERVTLGRSRVIPAHAGIQCSVLDSRLRGDDEIAVLDSRVRGNDGRAMLSQLVACLMLIIGSVATSPAQEPVFDLKQHQHGLPEVLVEKLVRDRELEQALDRIVHGDNGRLTDDSIAALQMILADTSDAFSVEAATGVAQGVRESALRHIRRDASSLRSWMDAVEDSAQLRWTSALESGDHAALRQIVHDLPLTNSAVDTALLLMTMDQLRSEMTPDSVVRQFERDHRGTLLEARAAKGLQRVLDSRVRENDGRGGIDGRRGNDGVVRLAMSNPDTTAEAAPPWPQPLWSWTEPIRDYSGAIQPDTRRIVDAFDPAATGRVAEFTNWRPVAWNGWLALRTPFRIVFLDPTTGVERWSIPTDTFTAHPDADESDERDVPPAFRVVSASSQDIAQLPAFGLLSSDGEFLYFIDGLDLFRADRRATAFPGRGGSDESPFEEPARRLVALKRGSKSGAPELAWIAGEPAHFDYRAVERASEMPSLSAGAETKIEDAPDDDEAPFPQRLAIDPNAQRSPTQTVGLSGHQFLSAPIGRDGSLFALTLYAGEYYLNCLKEIDGQLKWQQPLAYSGELASWYGDEQGPGDGLNVCLASGDLIISVLQQQVLVAVDAADGRLAWAATIADMMEPSRTTGFGVPGRYRPEVVAGTELFVPEVADDVLVCSNRSSSFVTGIDATNGKLLWRVSRQAFGSGDSGGSRDQLIAGISNEQIVLCGDRHCRSLNLKTGDQNWTVDTGRLSGRAWCQGDRCLIPLEEGRVTAVDLKSGRLIHSPRIDEFTQSILPFGAVTLTSERVWVSTPVTVVAYPRADVVEASPALPTDRGLSPADLARRSAQAALLNGRGTEAVAILESALAELRDEGSELAALEQAYAELLLQDQATRLVELGSVSEGSPDLTEAQRSLTQKLDSLSLTDSQRLRAAVLLVLESGSTSPLSAESAAELRSFADWSKPVTITTNWSVRPDLLLADAAPKPAEFSGTQEANVASLWTLKSAVPDAVLFPRSLSSDVRDEMATRLDYFRQSTSAELLWLSGQSLANANATEADRLRRLRVRDVIPGLTQSDATATATAISPGLTSKSAKRFEIDVEPCLRLPSAEWQQVENGTPLLNVPQHVPLRYFHINSGDAAGRDEIVSFDPRDGTIRDRVALPFDLGRNTISFRLLESGPLAPSLLPVTGFGNVAMVSCVQPGQASLLWSRRFAELTDNPAGQNVEFGSIGADHLDWHAAGVLHCSHPLTGEDLWTRELAMSPNEASFRSQRRIFGDGQVVVVMHADGQTARRFSTRTGAELGNVQLQVAPTHDPIPIGRCLLYADANSRLRVFDGLTGVDLLEDEDPIVLGRHNPDRTFSLLTNGRVVTASVTGEIAMIDTWNGRIAFRTSATGYLATKFVFGITAFERNGQLIVGLDDEELAPGGFLQPLGRNTEPRVGPGALLAMNPETGEINWGLRTERAVIPMISGDATDLLVLWSQQRPTLRTRDDSRTSPLNVRLIDGTSGQILATAASLSTMPPFRGVHVADESIIQLFTRDAEITIRAADERP